MANAVYPNWKSALMKAATTNESLDQNTTSDGPYCALVDTGNYTYNAGHNYYNDLGLGVVGTGTRITTPTVGVVSAATFDGDNVTFTAVTGPSVEALVVYRHNAGANTTWWLVLYLDAGVTGLPVTPNGGDIIVNWNAAGIFTLSDRRTKRDLVEIGKIGPLSVYEFAYIGAPGRHVGLVAQEVEAVVPEAVACDGGLLRVCYPRVLERLAA